jgi:hypothetical protein
MSGEFIKGMMRGEFGRKFVGPEGLGDAINNEFSVAINRALDEATVRAAAEWIKEHPELKVQFTELDGAYVGFSKGELILILISKPEGAEAPTGDDSYAAALAKQYGLPWVTDEAKAAQIRQNARERIDELERAEQEELAGKFKEALAKALLHGLAQAGANTHTHTPSSN